MTAFSLSPGRDAQDGEGVGGLCVGELGGNVEFAQDGTQVAVGGLSAQGADAGTGLVAVEVAEVDVEVGRERCVVDEFENQVAGRLVANNAAAHTEGGVGIGLTVLTSVGLAERLDVEVGCDVVCAAVLAAQLLHVVVDSGEDLRVVEVDEVGIPLGVSVLGEQRCVGRHDDDVGVALEACDVEGLGQGVLEGVAARGPFAEIDFRALAVVAVVEVGVVDVPSGTDVVVFVDNVDVLLAGELPAVFVVAAFEEGTYGADDLNLGMGVLDAAVEVEEALGEDIADEVFVADAEVFEVEGFGVSGFGTQTGEGRGLGVAVGPFDEVEQLLGVVVHLVPGKSALLSGSAARGVLAGHAGGEDGKGLGADVFTELEVFEESESFRLVVVPDVALGGTLPEGSDGLAPAVHVAESVAVAEASAGETDEAGMEVGEGLCEVGTKSVLAVTEGVLGEEADEVEGNASGVLWLDGERCTGGVGRGSQDGLLLTPLLAGGEGGASQFFVAVEQADEEFLGFGIKVLGKEAEVVFLALLQDDAVETVVAERCARLCGGEEGVVGVVGVKGLLGRDFPSGSFAFQFPETLGVPLAAVEVVVLEVAVLDKFGIESAVGAVVDVFEEDADEVGRDGFCLVGMEGQRGFNALEGLETLVVVAGRFAVLPVAPCGVSSADNGCLDHRIGHADDVSLVCLSVEGDSVQRTCGLVGLLADGLCLAPLLEVGAGGAVVVALRCGIDDAEDAVVLCQFGCNDVFVVAHVGIVLRLPSPEVVRTCSGKLVGTVIEGEDGIDVVSVVEGAGVEHTFFSAPCAIVAAEEGTVFADRHPVVSVAAVGHLQTFGGRTAVVGEHIHGVGTVGSGCV